MEQSEEHAEGLDQGPNAIVSPSSSALRVVTAAAMREEANATVLVPLEADENLQLPATTLSVSSMALATATTIAATTGSGDANINVHDAVIDLCSTSPAPSTSKSAATAAAAAAAISVDSSPEASSPPPSSDDTAGGTSTTIECPICLQTCIHPARLPCGHIFCFLCVKGVAYKNRRCAMCRREIPPEFLDHPDLVNGIDDICATKSTEDGYQWFYEGRNGGWWAYDPRSSKDIEEAYQTRMLGTGTIDLEEGCQHEILICGTVYTIDFVDMVQHPFEFPRRKRKICRSKHMPTKGWWQYDDRTSQDIEEAFKKGEKSCIILVAGYVYVVDLEAMVQQRQNEPSRCRRVKRDLATIPKKGVAGLRIEGNTVITDSNFASQIYQQQQQSIAVGLGALNTPTDSSSDLSLPLNYYSMRHPANASDFISTIAATDAAIRIASDIIGSTLAHADELSRSTAAVAAAASVQQQLQQHAIGDAHTIAAQQHMSGENTGNYSGSYHHQQIGNSAAGASTSSGHGHGHMHGHGHGGSVAAAALVAHGSRELLDAAEDLLDATQNVISEADQQTIDLFEQTLNDFHALTLRNIIDSDESDEDNGGGVGGGDNGGDGGGSGNGDDVDGRYAQRHIRF